MRTFPDIESPTRRKLHMTIGLGIVVFLYTLAVAAIRAFLL